MKNPTHETYERDHTADDEPDLHSFFRNSVIPPAVPVYDLSTKLGVDFWFPFDSRVLTESPMHSVDVAARHPIRVDSILASSRLWVLGYCSRIIRHIPLGCNVFSERFRRRA